MYYFAVVGVEVNKIIMKIITIRDFLLGFLLNLLHNMMMLTLTTFQMVALQGLPKYSILATKIIDFASELGEYVIFFTKEIFRGVEMSMTISMTMTIIHNRLFMMMVVMMVTIIFMDMRMMVIIIMCMPMIVPMIMLMIMSMIVPMIMLLSCILPGRFLG